MQEYLRTGGFIEEKLNNRKNGQNNRNSEIESILKPFHSRRPRKKATNY